ncbi:MAG: hypothetical protein ACLPUO_02780 [Streptosporangiaceae bacterium]|jgi:hypothetical protein
MRGYFRNASCLLGMGGLVLGVLTGGLAVASASVARTGASVSSHTCSGTAKAPGTLAGTYSQVVVSGVCAVNGGRARVRHNLVIASGGALLAVFGLNDHTRHGRSSLIVGGNLIVQPGASLAMGCDRQYDHAFGHTSANFACADDPHPNRPTLWSHDTVGGSLIARHPLGVVVHNSSIRGNVTETGGGGGLNCKPAGVFKVFKSPAYSDYEHTGIGGSMTVTGLRSCWFGSIYDHVHGSLTISGNIMADPDAMEVVTNTIRRNFACRGNRPAIQFGDSDGDSNRVGRRATGQCGFGVILPSPPPQAHIHVHVKHKHISVPLHHR